MYLSPFTRKIKQMVHIVVLHQPPVGRTERGFDFLGYLFGPEGLTIAQKTLDNFVERATRLYEQGPGGPFDSARLGQYVKRWVRWAGAGPGNMDSEKHGLLVILGVAPRQFSPQKRPLSWGGC